MKKAITIYIDDDMEVEGASVVLCTKSGEQSHFTGMFNSDMKNSNAIYFPPHGRIEEFENQTHTMTLEEVAEMLSDMLGECACDVNGNDEWLPQACKYADTECPDPKERNGCWMQFLMQGGIK